MEWNLVLLVVLALVNIPLYLFLGKMLFGNWDGFVEVIRYVIMPDILSLFKGEYLEDYWAELKFFCFIVLCIGCVFAEYTAIQKLFS